MEQKRVSLEVAKAIKEAGYNEPCDMYYHIYDDAYESEMSLEMTGNGCKDFINSLNRYRCAAPTYFDVWLWRYKKICLEVEKLYAHESYIQRGCVCGTEQCGGFYTPEVADPEEAIIAAIEYLCENDLIK